MTYILYNTINTAGNPAGYTSICKIFNDENIAEELSDMGLNAGDVVQFSDTLFSSAQLYFNSCFRFGPNNTVTFDLEAAREQTIEQVRQSGKYLSGVPGKFPPMVLSAQASLAEADRVPAVQDYFDAMNAKLSDLTDALTAISSAATAEILKGYLDS